MHVLDNKGEVWKTFIVLIPTLGAALIAVSRIMDARHHPFDVISGSLLGIIVAWAAYRQYFPPVTESWRKGRAYPIRTWGTEPTVPASEYNGLMLDGEDEPPQRNRTFPLDATGAQTENVFRQQISRSQRRRQDDFAQHSGQSSTSSLDLEGRHPRKPLPSTQQQTQDAHSDGYWSSSLDRDLNEDAFELRPLPARPDREQLRYQAPTNASRAEALVQDTAYHSGAMEPNVRREDPRGSGEHDMEGQRPRGVDLVETYR